MQVQRDKEIIREYKLAAVLTQSHAMILALSPCWNPKSLFSLF